jgi:hypothetical protein
VAVLLALPLVERFSGRTSNVRLRDLQNLEHPVLRRLLVEAPGTYHHSVIVGRLAEAAADAIGANGLLAKVASYFHDIGKLLKPGYFSENESTFSRHDVLSPSMSALIIIAHVKDGAEMGQELRLPREILDVIEQHHGTSLVRFFYHRAQKEAAARGAKTPETAYRYPGPLPQSREAGLVMLADAVEAASRSLAAPTEPQIRKLVHNVATEKLLDGQLDESGLTLTQIRRAESVFVRILTSLYHVRVAYPEGNAREGGPRRDRIRSASAS